MNRRNFIQNSALTLGALSISQQKILSALFQQSWKINMLTKEIGTFTERGGTIGFLLSKKEIVIIDSQFPEQAKHLIDELKKQSGNPISLLINTHHHGDHSGGNIAFKDIAGHVLAHENSLNNQKRVAVANKSEDRQLFPDQTYTSTWCQQFGKEKICLYYFGSAHTDGDSVIHFENANIAHMGDLLFNRRHPYVDRSSGASIKNWISVLDKTIQKLDSNTIYIFGHAAEGFDITGNAEDLKRFSDYLGAVLDFTGKEIKAGKTKEEFLKNTTFPGIGEWKGDGITRPLSAAWEELTSE